MGRLLSSLKTNLGSLTNLFEVTKAKACFLGKVVSFNGFTNDEEYMIFHLDICAHVGQEQYYKNVLVVCEVHGPGPI
jgi:hypothetical protein